MTTVECDGWRLHEIPVTASTNLAAAKLPVWEAVRADRQTAGRGRFQRGWVSDEGGLWLSAVIPAGPNATALPLAVGLAVCDALRSIGLKEFRVRWPNDVLVDDRKLAGLLIDQFVPEQAVAGIGINVFNHPETHDPNLKNQTARLADLITTPPGLDDLTKVMLSNLRQLWAKCKQTGSHRCFPASTNYGVVPGGSNSIWMAIFIAGVFAGVGEGGELLLLSDSGNKATYHAYQVRHLKELN